MDERIKAVVLDSPFTSAHRVVRDMLKRQNNIPHFISKMALIPIANTIKKKLGCDVIGKNKPKYLVKHIRKPAVFLLGERDTLVNAKKFNIMFAEYAGKPKVLRIMKDTEHGDFRDIDDTRFAYDFLYDILANKVSVPLQIANKPRTNTEIFAINKSEDEKICHSLEDIIQDRNTEMNHVQIFKEVNSPRNTITKRRSITIETIRAQKINKLQITKIK